MGWEKELFGEDELVKVPPPKRPVVLNCGGPIMELESVDDGRALCSWIDNHGKRGMATFALACLYECRPLES